MQSVLVGADPEFGLLSSDGHPAISIGRIGGSKASPLPVEYGALQEDNVLAEINIDPASSEDQFVHNILAVTAQLREKVQEQGLSLSQASSFRFDMDELLTYDGAFEFGCEPEYNAYTGLPFQADYDLAGTYRCAGGHVHIGFDNVTVERQRDLVKLCDMYLGLPSLLVDPDRTRREYYGKAGAYRPKGYGIEYRTLSNFWVHDERHIRWVYQSVLRAVSALNDPTGDACNNLPSTTVGIINTYDKGSVPNIINQLHNFLPERHHIIIPEA